jgi:hypothetical protein
VFWHTRAIDEIITVAARLKAFVRLKAFCLVNSSRFVAELTQLSWLRRTSYSAQEVARLITVNPYITANGMVTAIGTALR